MFINNKKRVIFKKKRNELSRIKRIQNQGHREKVEKKRIGFTLGGWSLPFRTTSKVERQRKRIGRTGKINRIRKRINLIKMKAIKKDIEKRTLELSKYYDNAERMATINLLEEIASAIDFYQKQTASSLKTIKWNEEKGLQMNAKVWFKNWQIQKATLTRLQQRYKKTLEILSNTK